LLVGVGRYQKRPDCYYTAADPGKVLVLVQVVYSVIDGDVPYGMFDWVAHDQDNTQYEVIFSTCNGESLDSGTLLAGRTTGGWVLFEVPAKTKHLWVDYKDSGDSWRLW
jgi:hypothetical protein